MRSLLKKSDLILLAAVIVLALAAFYAIRMSARTGAYCVVLTDGTVSARYPLDTPLQVTLTGYAGGENHLVIEEGAAYLTYADCPDGLCVRQGKITKNGESIICLPHRIVITIESKDAADVDMIAE